MKRKLLGRMALVTAAIAASAPVTTGRVSAELRVVSSDANARFMALGVSKSVVIELSTDVKSVVVADRSIATAVALSKRRVEIIGAGLGQTNIYFFDEHDRPIDGLNIAVKDTAQPIGLEDYPYSRQCRHGRVWRGQHLRHSASELHADPVPRCPQAGSRSASRHGEHQHQQQRPNRRSRARQMTAFGAVVKQPLQS
jgi:hypothetical protein